MDRIKNYIIQSPRLIYFEIQLIFLPLLIYFIISIFSFCLLGFDFYLQFIGRDIFKNTTRLLDIIYLLIFMFFQNKILFSVQRINICQKGVITQTMLRIFYVTLFFLCVKFIQLYLEEKFFTDVATYLWNTFKVMFFYFIAYVYFKYSKRANSYFSFYEKKMN